uniref:Uncharacterized protein n=1 Tax=Cyanothece sp. (strain PCC 7425 / ATCC 29141) TaxID=395961 RepID=B8HR55_CYAP4
MNQPNSESNRITVTGQSKLVKTQPADSVPVPYRLGSLPENRPIFVNPQPYRQGNLPDNRPIFPAELEVLPTSTAPGSRPVAVSRSLPLKEVKLSYGRPLFSSEMAQWPTYSLSGNRPVAPAPVELAEHPTLPNRRPIGAPPIEPAHELMGYLD